jgi:hypothetical protein
MYGISAADQCLSSEKSNAHTVPGSENDGTEFSYSASNSSTD